MTKVISIDFWGTLCEGNKEYSAGRLNIIAGYTKINNPALIKSAIKSVKDELFGVIDRTGLFFDGHYVCSAILSKLNYPAHKFVVNAIVSDLNRLFVDCPPVLISPLWTEYLNKWKSKHQLWVLSNTMLIDGKHMKMAMKKNGLYNFFTGSIFSGEHGYSKPNPLLYRILIQEAGVVPSEILHIGDNILTDIAGPATMGIKSLLFNKKEPFSDDYFKTI